MEDQIYIGAAATVCIGSDSYPYTVIDITPSGKTVTVQEDDHNYMSGDSSIGTAEYKYTQNPNGRIMKFRYSKKYKRWKNTSYRVYFGHRRFYQDPHF